MSDIQIITANAAAALAASLCRVQVIAAYPITPQTPVTEDLAAMVESKELDAEYLTVESEHSAMASVIAAAQIGARVFTATSANGLLYMHEMLHWGAGSRVPVVMACVNRGVGAPWTILNDQQDSISQRDTGWIQLYCRNSQEVLDTIIQAYKIAETALIPVMVCYDGFILSHTSTPVDVPSRETVDAYLPYAENTAAFVEDQCMNINPLILADPRPDASGDVKPGYMELRHSLHQDLLRSLSLITDVADEFEAKFGRQWGGVLWNYRMEDADYALVSMGSLASECSLAADKLREQGHKFGVVGIRAYRPFPEAALRDALGGVRSLCVIEKAVSYGYAGAVAMDIKAALFDLDSRPHFSSYVAGLGGRDVRPEQLVQAALATLEPKTAAPQWIDVRR